MSKKRNNRIQRLLIFYTLIIVILAVLIPKKLDWRPSFSKDHSIPYGAEALYKGVEGLFGKEKMIVSDQELATLLKNDSILNTHLIIIAQEFLPDSLSVTRLMDFIAKGNVAFIAAEFFNQRLEDSLGVFINNMGLLMENMEGGGIEVTLNHKNFESAPSFQFKPSITQAYFQLADSLNSQITSLGKAGKEANFIRIKKGKGEIFLHGFPSAFTNYYFLKEETRSYLEGCFSYLSSAETVIWDEYYKPLKELGSQSPLGVLLAYPSFRWAYWLTLTGVGMYILFHGKRRQRAIPILTSPRNEQINFIKTLGSLYYKKGNHKNLIDKKLQVFKEYLASVYGMKDIAFTTQEAKLLHEKSGKDFHLIDRVFEMARLYKDAAEISERQLKILVDRINKFYNRNKKKHG